MFFNLTVPTIYATMDAQTRPAPSVPTGARPFAATLATAVRRLRALGAAIPRSSPDGAHDPLAFGSTDAGRTRLDIDPTVQSADELRWNKVIRNQVFVRRF